MRKSYARKNSQSKITMERFYAPSELIINEDGSVFHLHIRPGQISNKIILVGDPGRVDLIASHFDSIEWKVQNREFHSVTGSFGDKRVTAISTGIGCGNIDIVMNELDALANIDFGTRKDKPQKTSLEIVRIGTCGGLQENTKLGTYVCSTRSIGFDGLLNFYKERKSVCDLSLEAAFVKFMGWIGWRCAPYPYVAIEDGELTDRIAGDEAVRGITVSAPGFFGPQGRFLRAEPADPIQNEKVEQFEYNGMAITNYEMESSALAGLSSILGHKAACICMVVANRREKEAFTNYKQSMDSLVQMVLTRI